MSNRPFDLRATLREWGLLQGAQALTRPLRNFRSYRALREYRGRYEAFARAHGDAIGTRLRPAADGGRIALVSSVHFPEVELEIAVLKALELAGFIPVVLVQRDDWLLRRYYDLAAVEAVHSWGEFTDGLDLAEAGQIVDGCASTKELLGVEAHGSRVGMHAVSTAMRHCRMGSFELPEHREILVRYVAISIANAEASRRILERYDPAIAVLIDKGYTPKAEFFDLCLGHGVDCVSWDLAHTSSALNLKRFNYDNRGTSTDSLSMDSWEQLCGMEFGADQKKALEEELMSCYASGDWYSVAGTQFNKRLVESEEISERLGLDRSKKSAIVFPHVSWDATLFWGGSLYDDYEQWLIDTVRAACENAAVNWVVKIHPAHIGKAIREGFHGEPAEAITLREHIGPLPPHVKVLPPESDISTNSLFPIMDYCITVRGRVGVEAARLGIPVLTSGKGAYDHRGFTVDSVTKDEYLERLHHLDAIPPLSPEERELAERFAYGFFMQRPLRLDSVGLTYDKSHEKGKSVGVVRVQRPEDWYAARDVNLLADWLKDRSREDFLIPFEEDPTEER